MIGSDQEKTVGTSPDMGQTCLWLTSDSARQSRRTWSLPRSSIQTWQVGARLKQRMRIIIDCRYYSVLNRFESPLFEPVCLDEPRAVLGLCMSSSSAFNSLPDIEADVTVWQSLVWVKPQLFLELLEDNLVCIGLIDLPVPMAWLVNLLLQVLDLVDGPLGVHDVH